MSWITNAKTYVADTDFNIPSLANELGTFLSALKDIIQTTQYMLTYLDFQWDYLDICQNWRRPPFDHVIDISSW